ncbi:MAG: heat-inducible transcriptional repressor HrcA [Chloroflexota bacterium]
MLLTERQEQILRIIVEQYVAAAHPVGSAAIVGASDLRVSSATVRHEMAVLEDLGYIHQLHTSGGRVPTNAGYRYFVERIMRSDHLPSAEARTILHQFHQSPTDPQEWLKLAATVMAYRMHNVGLITAPRSSECRLRHVEAIATQNRLVLLVVVLADGAVLQEMLPLAEPCTQDELSALADRLNRAFRGSTAAQVEAGVPALPAVDASIAAVVAHLLRRSGERDAQVFHAGLADMLSQPEFATGRSGEAVGATNERLRHMVDFLQQGFAIQQLLSLLSSEAEVQVVIGGDSPGAGLQDYSFVLGRYGEGESSSGYLGIVGPTRLQYPRAVALVRYMTQLMTELIQAY